MDAVTHVPAPANEPVLDYAPGSPERATLEAALAELGSTQVDLPHVIGGEQVIGAGEEIAVRQPHAHAKVLGTLRGATTDDASKAVAAAKSAAPGWRELSFDDRAAILLKAAELLSGPWRARLNAATMLGQSKTAYQAEIDAACELIDFWRLNVHFARQILEQQPPLNAKGVWNRSDYRSLEGFVFAITPFNFTAIAGNLPTAPALMGNTVVWKPAVTQQRAASLIDGAARGGRPAARGHQHGDRSRRQGLQGRPHRRGPCRHPLHWLDADVQAPVEGGRDQPRPLPHLSHDSSGRRAARTSSSPTPPPTRRCCGRR